MPEPDDHELLAQYAHNECEAAFSALVTRYMNLVYSAALRFTNNSHHAEEITQAVFIILARKARSLGRNVVLSGWLYQTARLTSANFVKGEIRRQRREQEAYMQSTLSEPESAAWEKIAPLLDDAMGRLGETDRNAVVLRFFENKTAREVGETLKMNEAATRMRVNRALEKLRKFFIKRGVISTTAIIAGVVSANSVQAAPVAMVTSVSAVAIAKGAVASGSTLTLVKGALKIMAWIKIKTAIAVSLGVVLVAGTTAVGVATIGAHAEDEAIWTDWNALRKAPPMLVLRPTKFPSKRAGAEETHDGKFRARGMFSKWLLAFAYDSDDLRTILPADFPERDFDLLFTLPKNRKQALRDEIKKQLGLVAYKETRETNVLVLKMKNPNAPGIRISAGKESEWKSERYKYFRTNQEIDFLVSYLGSRFETVVIDRTGLLGTYDIVLEWKPTQDWKVENEEIKQALVDQLGLELVSAKEPIEMLIVERVKD